MKKYVTGWYAIAIVILGLITTGFGGAWIAHDSAVQEGVNKYHDQCLIGGIIIRPSDRTVVGCQPLGVIPKEEKIPDQTS